MMQLELQTLDPATRGIYNVRGKGPKSMPDRALKLHPLAATSFENLEVETGGLIYSDIFRSAEVSLWAMRSKRGVQPPGYSGHNYGFCVDIAVEETLAARRWTYEALLDVMKSHGWYCHRRDGGTAFEAWHFNYLGAEADLALARTDPKTPRTWADAIEYVILRHYGSEFTFDDVELQRRLQTLKLYRGAIDGDAGPLTLEAVSAFQRTWGLTPDGVVGPRTRRTLTYVTAEEVLRAGTSLTDDVT